MEELFNKVLLKVWSNDIKNVEATQNILIIGLKCAP